MTLLIGIASVAFTTLIERKVLGLRQIRLGPNKTSFRGVLQPVVDGIKLLWKAMFLISQRQVFIYTLSPSALLFLFIILWGWVLPWSGNELLLKYSRLLYFSILGISAYAIILTGWRRIRRFSKLGSLRGMLQRLSFEVALILIFIIVLSIVRTFSINIELDYHIEVLLFWIILWVLVSLIETNRAPFDLLEGERELIRGFNIEMGRFIFVFIFLREYGIILVIGAIFSVARIRKINLIISIIFILFVLIMRSCFPRIRYDVIIEIIWQIVLPISVIFFFIRIF